LCLVFVANTPNKGARKVLLLSVFFPFYGMQVGMGNE